MRERWPHLGYSEEDMRRPGRDRWPGRARPHVDGADPGVVEGRTRDVAPALVSSQCSGAAGAAAATAAVVTTTAATTTTTPAAAATPTTAASAASA
jgi:hypothetical protein